MEVLTVTEAAKILRLNMETVLRMIRRGDLKAAKIGRMYRIEKSEIERFIKGE